ncbi:MAG: hypothetical protein AAB821_02000, partial [Patescibacteria group bacterium]
STWAGSTNLTTLGTIATGVWSGTAIAVAKGGTALTATPTYGQLLVGNGTGYTLSATSTLGIAISDTTGTLAVAKGGTCLTAFGGTNTLLYTTTANNLSSITTANTSALVTNSSGIPSFTSGGTANRLLRTDGTTVSFGQAVLTTDVSGTLPVANGGTNATSQSTNGVNYFNGTSITSGTSFVFNGTNVGIGTTTPNNLLDIYSTTKPAIGFSGASGSTYKWTMGMDVSNGGRFAIASSTALGTNDMFVINGSGYVGVGTASPGATLTVDGNIDLGAGQDITTGSLSRAASITNLYSPTAMTAATVGTESVLRMIRGGTGGTKWNASVDFLLGTHTAGLASKTRLDINLGDGNINTPEVNVMSLLSTGVGIGTTTPWGALSVTNTGSGPSLIVEDAASPDSTPFIVDAAGLVGIGTASPSQELEVLSSASGGNVFVVSDSAGIDTSIFRIFEVSGGGGLASLYSAADAEAIRLSATGDSWINTGNNLAIGNTAPTYTLDVTGNARFTSLVDASRFVATSSTATSTFAGGLAVETSGLVYDYSTNRVGIGTAVPGSLLHVSGGEIKISSGSASSNSYANRADSLILTRSDIHNTYTNKITSSWSATPANTTLNFELASGSGTWASVMTMTGGGLVGIGSTTPEAKLTVQNTGTGNSFIVEDQADDNSPFVIDASG